MTDEAMKAMARRICANACGIGKIGRACAADFLSGRADDETDMAIALAAIIETQERDAALVEDGFRCRTCDAIFAGSKGHPIPECERPNWDNLSPAQIAAAIRSGQQFRKDV